jgi:hypothetical protein
MQSHDIICLHTMVGFLTSTDSMFKQNGYGGTESHFGIGGKWGGDARSNLDGIVYQWQDLDFTADANYQGNSRIISIETGDNAPQSASNLAAWTPRQIDAIVKLVAWLCKKYNIPPMMVRDSRPGRRGIAVHRQGIEHGDGVDSHPGWLVSGGERWSISKGKECPGSERIRQLSHIIIPRVQDVLTGDDNDMIEADFDRVQAMITTAQKTATATLRADIENIMIKVLTKLALVENKPTEAMLEVDPKAKPSLASFSWFMSNIETDIDNDRDKYLVKIKEQVDKLVTNLVPEEPPTP